MFYLYNCQETTIAKYIFGQANPTQPNPILLMITSSSLLKAKKYLFIVQVELLIGFQIDLVNSSIHSQRSNSLIVD